MLENCKWERHSTLTPTLNSTKTYHHIPVRVSSEGVFPNKGGKTSDMISLRPSRLLQNEESDVKTGVLYTYTRLL